MIVNRKLLWSRIKLTRDQSGYLGLNPVKGLRCILFDERVFSSVAYKRTSAIYLEETPWCRLRPLTLDKAIFRTKKLFKDNSSYHNYMRLANRGEVVDKALVTLKFELPSNSGPVDICTFHFMALICGQIFQKDTSTLASHADVNEALRTSAWEAISTSKMG